MAGMAGPAPLVQHVWPWPYRFSVESGFFFLLVIVQCFFGRDPATAKLRCSCCHERFNTTDMSTKVT